MEIEPIVGESFSFFVRSKFQYFFFKIFLIFKFFKYIFNHKIQNGWKKLGDKYLKHKLEHELFKAKFYIIVESDNKRLAQGKIKSLFNNFSVFKNYPLNQFKLKFHNKISSIKPFHIA